VVTNIELSADGKLLAVATLLPTLEVWDIEQEKALFAVHFDQEIYHVEWSPHDKT
jgi:hypothetical protein